MEVYSKFLIFVVIFNVVLLPMVKPGITFFSRDNFQGEKLHILPLFVGCVNMPDSWRNRTRSIISDVHVVLYIRPWCHYRDPGSDPFIGINPGMYPRPDTILYWDPIKQLYFPLKDSIISMNDARNRPDWKTYPGLESRQLDLDLVDSDEIDVDFDMRRKRSF